MEQIGNQHAPGHGLPILDAHPSGRWLSVPQAAAYCAEKGLSRTPKTIRRRASRSGDGDPENPDVVVRSQDTDNGFRWLIEKNSLDLKIEQEIDFEKLDSVETPDRTRPDMSSHGHLAMPEQNSADTPEDASTHVRTGTDKDKLIERLEGHITFLQEELAHRRTTDTALQDVIAAFGNNARAQLLTAENKQHELNQDQEVTSSHVVHSPEGEGDEDNRPSSGISDFGI